MKYEDIKDFSQRCEEHPDHQTGMISERMIQQRLNEEIDELRAYIETKQEQGEPVAWAMLHDNGAFIDAICPEEHAKGEGEYTHPLYTTPQRKPLTDEQIQEVMTKAVQAKEVSWVGYKENEFGRYTIPVLSPYHFQIVRAIEAAHGIKENI